MLNIIYLINNSTTTSLKLEFVEDFTNYYGKNITIIR